MTPVVCMCVFSLSVGLVSFHLVLCLSVPSPLLIAFMVTSAMSFLCLLAVLRRLCPFSCFTRLPEFSYTNVFFAICTYHLPSALYPRILSLYFAQRAVLISTFNIQ